MSERGFISPGVTEGGAANTAAEALTEGRRSEHGREGAPEAAAVPKHVAGEAMAAPKNVAAQGADTAKKVSGDLADTAKSALGSDESEGSDQRSE